MAVFDFDKVKVESTLHYYWRKTCEKGKQVLYFVEDHKEGIALATPVLLGIAGIGSKLIRGISRHRNLAAEKDLKDLHVYDRRIGAYLRLRRPLTNKDWTKITPRMKKGERLADILQSMDMLK